MDRLAKLVELRQKALDDIAEIKEARKALTDKVEAEERADFTEEEDVEFRASLAAFPPVGGFPDSSFGSASGGRGGFWAWDTIQEGVDFTAGDTITVVVGTGRGGGDGNVRPGDPCTITVGIDVLTAPPGTSHLGNQSGKPPTGGNAATGKNVSLNGQTYVGGDANGEAPGAGGKGGGGGFQPGERSGDGRAWLYVYPQS